MKILITGAAGYLGNKLAHQLAGMGNEVHALVRSDVAGKLLRHPNISIFKGDILDKESLLRAAAGCQQLYHTAAKVGSWARDPSVFYRTNVDGTRNVLETALQCGIEKSVFTSTCGIIGPSLNKPMSEVDEQNTGTPIDYDLSKKMGEELVFEYAKKGLNAVVVCPSKIYGPGNISHSLTANAVISRFLNQRITFIPSPGTYEVCFAFIDDVVNGHLQAMEKGKSGEKYILGGINISYLDFFTNIRRISSCNGQIIMLSKNIIKVWALLEMLKYRISGVAPRFTIRSVDYIFHNYTFSSGKAIRELGYRITPLEDALKKTIQFLMHANNTRAKHPVN